MPIRIAYASHVCPHVGRQEMDDVVTFAEEFNRRNGITGVLAFDGFQVVQILEGPRDVVEALYDRILKDDRHEGIVTLQNHEIEVARFPDWSMIQRPIADVLMLVEDLK
ncbi:BLUF domain-containing protein [Aureimonas glaciei]|uniref:Blue-light sensor BLUF n=1 Tax=Aureimonas glaciei TaxID=1776957 RepID=A0A916Y2U9_9HYPH|nr:BLUF domain-containing protein [Aureimonas glaciei]GGD28791.1 blue-light sensor BLUF [Aureimonas glaciei]